jgi:hypothetical protein
VTDGPDEPERPSLEGVPVQPGGTGGNNPGGANGASEAAAVRGNRALELRMAGASYSQIATALGFADRGAAHHAVQNALARDNEVNADLRDEYRTLQLARTERMIRGIWTQAIGGDGPAYDRVLRTLDRQAKLIGLDAPVQINVTDEARARLTAMLDQLEAEVVKGEVLEAHDEPEPIPIIWEPDDDPGR